jgi:hypothetical protein
MTPTAANEHSPQLYWNRPNAVLTGVRQNTQYLIISLRIVQVLAHTDAASRDSDRT